MHMNPMHAHFFADSSGCRGLVRWENTKKKRTFRPTGALRAFEAVVRQVVFFPLFFQPVKRNKRKTLGEERIKNKRRRRKEGINTFW